MMYWSTICCFFVYVSVHLTEGSSRWSWWLKIKPGCCQNPPIGCFPTSHPYRNTAGIAPKGPARQTIEFQFKHRNNEKSVFRYENAREVLQTVYNSTAKTIVLIHGYREDPEKKWIKEMTQELFNKHDNVNIIVVDWHRGATDVVYLQSVANTRVVGAVLALVIKEMETLGGDLASFHLIGFSLGAHLAGYAGEQLPGLGRITGLDPAGPAFRDTHSRVRLDPTDAVVVDVYHTDSDDETGFGLWTTVGTVDFYLNGGKRQPGCQHHVLDRLALVVQSDFQRRAMMEALTCAHSRAYNFFITTINPRCQHQVIACKTMRRMRIDRCNMCQGEQCPVVGYNFEATNLDFASIGRIFNLTTTASAPYCGSSRQEPTLNAFMEASRGALSRSQQTLQDLFSDWW